MIKRFVQISDRNCQRIILSSFNKIQRGLKLKTEIKKFQIISVFVALALSGLAVHSVLICYLYLLFVFSRIFDQLLLIHEGVCNISVLRHAKIKAIDRIVRCHSEFNSLSANLQWETKCYLMRQKFRQGTVIEILIKL